MPISACHGNYQSKQGRITKKTQDCPAAFKMEARRDEEGNEIVRLIGCLTHSHEYEHRFKKVSAKTKDGILGLSKMGLEPKEMHKRYYSVLKVDPSKTPDKPILLDNIIEILETTDPKIPTTRFPEPEALIRLAEEEHIRKFNFSVMIPNQEEYFDEEIANKIVPTTNDKFFIMHMSERQRLLFQKYPQQVRVLLLL